MSENYLMKKGEATMFVSPSKLEAFKADGWIVLQEPDPKPKVQKVNAPPAPPAPEPEDEAPVSAEETAQNLGKRGKRGK
jgi:hypothetical protein